MEDANGQGMSGIFNDQLLVTVIWKTLQCRCLANRTTILFVVKAYCRESSQLRMDLTGSHSSVD
jgi:hypothetical protein